MKYRIGDKFKAKDQTEFDIEETDKYETMENENGATHLVLHSKYKIAGNWYSLKQLEEKFEIIESPIIKKLQQEIEALKKELIYYKVISAEKTLKHPIHFYLPGIGYPTYFYLPDNMTKFSS